MKKHILLTCVSLLVSLLSISASIEVRSTHMTTTDGLANNSICYIFQDSKGFIWMGTPVSYTHLTLPTNSLV